MRSSLCVATMSLVLWGGCASETVPTPASTPSSDDLGNSASNQLDKWPISVTVRKPVVDIDEQSPEKSASVRTMDDFGLPLVIVLKAPEVPEQIRGPSPPIKEEAKKTPEKSSGWW